MGLGRRADPDLSGLGRDRGPRVERRAHARARHDRTPNRQAAPYLPDLRGRAGGDLVVVASKAGEDENPDWFKNLQANPSAGVQVGPRRFTAAARIATDAERERLWPMMARIFPLYDEYAQKTDRVIPIVLLTQQN